MFKYSTKIVKLIRLFQLVSLTIVLTEIEDLFYLITQQTIY